MMNAIVTEVNDCIIGIGISLEPRRPTVELQIIYYKYTYKL